MMLVLRVSRKTKWALRSLAADQQTTMGRFAVRIIEDFIAESAKGKVA